MSPSSLRFGVSCRSARCRLALALAIVAVGGCNRVLPYHKTPPKVTRPTVFLASNRNVDLLFLVDDSSSMRLSQDNLLRNFPVLMKTLEDLPGGLPNVHIAVVSSDMGAGNGTIPHCDATGGKNGIFQSAPRAPCASSGLAPGATYISNVGGVKNYTGALPDVFTCIAALGEQGCGFEHQFAAITRALGVDGQAAPAENAGFLRPDALLAIVMITNEDDCSASPGVALYDAASNNLMSKFGPVDNFRCNEFGHICDGGHPSRFAPNNDPNALVSYTDCTSNESEGFLLGVEDTADRLRTLKADDGQIMVAAITGPATPYVVGWKTPPAADRSCGKDVCPWPVIGHACMADDGSFGDPSVRIAELVDQFHDNGRLISICDGDFAPALGSIADNIAKYVSAPCITTGQVAKKSGTTRDDCSVIDNVTGKPIPACADTGDAGVCWRLVPGGATCSGVAVAVQPDPTGAMASSQNITVQCTLCAPGVTDALRGCP